MGAVLGSRQSGIGDDFCVYVCMYVCVSWMCVCVREREGESRVGFFVHIDQIPSFLDIAATIMISHRHIYISRSINGTCHLHPIVLVKSCSRPVAKC